MGKFFTGDKNAGSGAMQQANKLAERAIAELEKVGIPEIEAQRIILERPELILASQDERILKSALEDIIPDLKLEGIQKQALQETLDRSKKGLTEEDIARFEALRSQTAGDEQARQQSILQSMAQRGSLDSGAQLAAQLASSQAATQRQSQASRDIAGQASQARQNALSQASQMAGQMSAADMQRQMEKASAKDRIAQFNAAVSTRDTAAKQNYAQQMASMANQQEMYNKGLIQQKFQNEMAKAGGMASAANQAANMAMNQAQMQAQASQAQAAGNRAMLMGGIQAGAMAFKSDEDLKKNIKPASEGYVEKQIEDMFDKLEPKAYEYKDGGFGEGRRAGIMAQDLERSKLGRSMVTDAPDGKEVDIPKATSSLLAAVAQLQKRVDKVEDQKNEKGGKNYFLGGIADSIGKGLNKIGLTGENAYKISNRPETLDKLSQYAPQDDLVKNAPESKAGLGALRSMENLQKNNGGSLAQAKDDLIKDEQTAQDVADKIDSDELKKKIGGGLEGFSKGMKAGEGSIPGMPQLQNIGPVDVQIPQNSMSTNLMSKIAEQIGNPGMAAANGGMKKMAYEDGGAGTIIPGENYAGDKLKDNINSGEMVLNAEQQDRLNDLLLDYKRLKSGERTDTLLDEGEKSLNHEQQEAIMKLLRGEKDVKELPDDRVVKSKSSILDEIFSMLGEEE